MKTAQDAKGARGERPQRIGLCLVCGLPAAGKSTLARGLRHRLRQEQGWAVGVVAYDDVMPDAFLEEASARPLSHKEREREREAETQAEGEAGSMHREPDVGFDPGSPGSRPGPKAGAKPLRHPGIPPSQWKLLRQELLKYLECFLMAVINGCQVSAPPNRTAAMWEDFIICLKHQDLVSSAALETQSCYLLTKTAVSRPLFLILDDNFYYQSMRYEVYQLARKYSLGFCQLFLDCSLETCLQRNGQRPQALPAETIHLMEGKIEKPNPEKNAWEHNSLIIPSTTCSSEASLKLTDLLLTALENPVTYIEDNVEQKKTDRIICSTNVLHQADQMLRRIVSQTMKEAKDEQVLPFNLKLLAEELNKLKAEFLEDLKHGNKKYLCSQQTIHIPDIISFFHYEKDNIVRKYFSKPH
ncbi:L-seryl-tRNA(Sec) kinase isoform X1 [Canis lupus dingo]|uniref:L-seryl-tRNA(Sec) kinase isoform X1 n=2 Tax=Canis lupus dingo TaxID=286419 RepID=UPI0020C4E234|nr:L-seryl-tRNA(Sec) kinase isoform X1 [Canis lupus dingo]